MSLFYKTPKEEKPSDLETILDLQDQNTRQTLLLEWIGARLRSGEVLGGTVCLNGIDGAWSELEMHRHLTGLQWIAQEYVKLTEKHNEPIPERLAKYCEKYREKKPDSPH